MCYGPDTVYYMKLSQGQTIQKPKVQELSSLFMTHHLNVMHAPIKFHGYIPYGLGVKARTWFTMWNLVKGKYFKNQKCKVVFIVHDTSPQCDACTRKVS